MKKYRALRFVSAFYKVLGILAIIGGIAWAAYTIYLGTQVASALQTGVDWTSVLLSAGGALVGGIISGIVLIAFGQLLELLMDIASNASQIEYNTRGSAKFLQRLASRTAGADGLGPRGPRPRSVLEGDDDSEFPFLK